MPARERKSKQSSSRSSRQTSSTTPTDDADQTPETSPTSPTTETVEDDNDSKGLITTLKKQRKKTQKELDVTIRAQDQHEDVKSELRKAKARTKQRSKILSEQSSATDAAVSTTVTSETTGDQESSDKPSSTDQGSSEKPSSTDTSKPTTVSTPRDTSKAAAASKAQQLYKQRLAERMKQAKDKGKQEAFEQAKQRRLGGERDMVVKTRFDTADAQALLELEAEELKLQESLRKKEKWRDSMKALRGSMFHMPSEQEQFDFFTLQWEEQEMQVAADKPGAKQKEQKPPPEPSVESDKKDEEEEEEEKETASAEDKPEEPTTEDTAPLVEPEDDDFESNAWRFYVNGRADYTSFSERLEKEEEAYSYVSIAEAPLEQRLFNRKQRDLAEEGLFVGQKPPVPDKVLHRMENRLLLEEEQAKKWFGEDGRLIALPNPVKSIPTRPIIPEEITEPALKTAYIKAELNDFDSRFIDGSVEPRGLYRLDIDINSVTFTHHHLFSAEHVLSHRLTEQFHQYTKRRMNDTVALLTEKIKALKLATAHVRTNIEKIKIDKQRRRAGLKEQEARLKDYKSEVRNVRKQRDLEMKADRDLLLRILKTWRSLKATRKEQSFTTTSTKLLIKKEPADIDTDEAEWQQDMNDELEEALEDVEEEYTKDMDKYQQLLLDYKAQKQRKKEAKKRLKELRKKHKLGESPEDEAVTHEEETQIREDEEILAENDLPEPTKPAAPGEQGAMERIRHKYQEIRRKPGEPKLYLELSNDAAVSAKEQCPTTERQRRSDINRYRIYVRILFNNKEVSRTIPKPLGQDFTVSFAQIYPTEIVQWPNVICLQVYEQAGVGTTLLSEVYLPIPELTATSDTVQLEDVEFSSDVRVKHSHKGVGSGTPFPLIQDKTTETVSLYTSGVLTCSAAWGVDSSGVPLAPPSNPNADYMHSALRELDPLGMMGMAALSDIDKLSKWIEQSKLDPNDPSNADLMFLMKPTGGNEHLLPLMQLPEHFRLEHLQEEFNFCTDEDINTSRRYRMIKLRESEVQEFKNKVVPALDKEVSEQTFEEYEKKKQEEENVALMAEKDSHKAIVQKYMHEVRKQVYLRFRLAAHQKTYADMVYEDAIPNISLVLPTLLLLAEPRRPLKPVRKERKKVTPQVLQTTSVNILVNIVRAIDIPVRSEAIQAAEAQAAAGPRLGKKRHTVRNIAGQTLVRPFIEASFQRKIEATSVADGPNPSWNEELLLPFQAPNNDYSPSTLQAIDDCIYLNLFDEYVEEKAEDTKEDGSATTFRRQIEKRWLGYLKIPFSTIYSNSRIDGTFKIQKPPVLLGYKNRNELRQEMAAGIEGFGEGDNTYLTIFMTMEPPLAPTDTIQQKFSSNEDERLIQHSEQFVNTLQKKFPKRQMKTMVVDINGKSVFITRYFRPLNAPPNLLDEAEHTNAETAKFLHLERLARFVSLIPYATDVSTFPGLMDIWSTCDQFLLMNQGDEDEHAVLLTNYFLHQDSGVQRAWLLIGNAVPEGPTAYVLTEINNSFQVWNANTGEYYDIKDFYCPLKSVGCVVNDKNIWINIQQQDHPSRITYNFSDTACWKPFFPKDKEQLATIQPSHLSYLPTDPSYVQDQQEKIERYLKEKLQSWRPKYITRWNRYCVHSLRKLLEKLELKKSGAQQEHSEELASILSSYKMCGFPINVQLMDLENIADEVFATGVHKLETSNVEFALAVHIHPYPNMVLSIWIYVASLVRKR